jgi:ABC-type Zn uptake system ZnuABC Zn-binding protein ZnuA
LLLTKLYIIINLQQCHESKQGCPCSNCNHNPACNVRHRVYRQDYSTGWSEQHKITVVMSFYPLYEFGSRVGWEKAEVSTLVPAKVAGGRVLMLSPIEGINQDEQDASVCYIDKMSEDVTNLKVGLECR